MRPPLLNELDAVCVQLPDHADRIHNNRLVPLVVDAAASGLPGAPTLFSPSRLAWSTYSFISTLCHHRAALTVDGRLVVRGRSLTPEAYLARWRKALEAPLTPAVFAARYGLELVAVLSGPATPLYGVSTRYTGEPFATFEEAIAKYASTWRESIVGDGEDAAVHFTLPLALSAPDGARDAIALQRMFPYVRGASPWRIELQLQPVAAPTVSVAPAFAAVPASQTLAAPASAPVLVQTALFELPTAAPSAA